MLRVLSGTWKAVVSGLVCAGLAVCASSARGQARQSTSGGGGFSTSKMASPAVVASWRTHENYADGSSTTLLVLWRGTPGWFVARGGASSGAGSSGGGSFSSSSSYAYEYITYGGRTCTMEFDDNRKIVKLLNQEISLKDTNVVLVDFVDSPERTAIVGYRWVEPEPPAPPLVNGAIADPIAGVIMRSPELYEYLRCDLKVADPLMNAMMPMICGLMRGERTLPPALAPR
jgi:hypothetical protein